MKKKVLAIVLCVAMTLALGTSVIAAAGELSKDPVVTAQTVEGLTNLTAVLNDDKESVTVSFTGSAYTNYSILMVKASYDIDGNPSYNVGVGQILYINQMSDASGAVSINVYPSAMTNSVILVSGSDIDSPALAATVRIPYTLGDANLDGYITVADITAVANHITGVALLEGAAFLSGDANEDGSITVADITAIANHITGVSPLV